jgi:hypothetical protein
LEPRGFKRSALWRSTLEKQLGSDDQEEAREQLRRAYLGSRKKAALIASATRDDLPHFTLHDISHSDSLWSVADLFIGQEVPINPAEAFVLGSAFLIHDLALSSLTYRRNIETLREDEKFQDILGFVYRRAGRVPRNKSSVESIPHELELQALQMFVREHHAERAETLATDSLAASDQSPSFIIDDEEIRSTFGELIGKIAHSHWWSVDEVGNAFPRNIPAPAFLPSGWSIDPIKVACLLRLADAAHLDSTRAPSLMMLLQMLDRASKPHWQFQNKLHPASVENGQLVFSGQPFGPNHYLAWWLCYKMLASLDLHIREVRSFLTDLGKPYRLAVGSVRGAQAPRDLAKDIPAKGWLPVEARVKISNALGLIHRLGGEELYGRDATVPLRELIQNACDAVQARRNWESLDEKWGEVVVRHGETSGHEWIEVQDNGIGMSQSVLAGALIDFGSSFWNTADALKEYPGLAASSFSSRGRYGIGFFSVFMVAKTVVVRSRRCDLGNADTNVLTFQWDELDRPLVREAQAAERLPQGGTVVRLYLKDGVRIDKDILGPIRWNKPTWSLQELVSYLAPTSEVTIRVQGKQACGGNGRSEATAVEANDWKTLLPELLIERVKPLGKSLFFDAVSGEARDLVQQMLEDVLDSTGRVVGRAALDPFGEFSSAVCDKGLRGVMLDFSAGVLLGSVTNVARNQARPEIDLPSLANWASNQVNRFRALSKKYKRLHSEESVLALLTAMCGGEYRQLRAAQTTQGWVTFNEIEGNNTWKDEIVLIPTESANKLKLTNPDFQLPENVWICPIWDDRIRLGREEWDPWPQNLTPSTDPLDPSSRMDHFPMVWKGNYSILLAISLSRAWSIKNLNATLSVYDGAMGHTSIHDTHGVHDNHLDIIRGTPITRPFHIIRNPHLWTSRDRNVVRQNEGYKESS